MTKEPASGNNRFMSRRTMMTGALGATAAIPATALAYRAPVTDEPVELPDWRKKLADEVAKLNGNAIPHLGTGGKYAVVRTEHLDAVVSLIGEVV